MLSMPIANATMASSVRASREPGSVTPSRLEQHHHRAAASLQRARLDEGEHLVAAHELAPDAPLQHRLAPDRAQPLAVHDAHAAQPAALAVGEERGGRGDPLLAAQALQVE